MQRLLWIGWISDYLCCIVLWSTVAKHIIMGISFKRQKEADLITCMMIDTPQPRHQTDPHHEGSEDNAHQRSCLHHRAWRQSVCQEVRLFNSNTGRWPLKWDSPLCSGSELATGETLSLLVLWPAGGISSLGTSELRGWVTTMGLERFLTSHWEGNTREGPCVSNSALIPAGEHERVKKHKLWFNTVSGQNKEWSTWCSFLIQLYLFHCQFFTCLRQPWGKVENKLLCADAFCKSNLCTWHR